MLESIRETTEEVEEATKIDHVAMMNSISNLKGK